MKNKKALVRAKRHKRITLKIHGSATRPRLVVLRSIKHLSAQLVDDVQKKTLFSFSTTNKEMKSQLSSAGNVKSAILFGEAFAKRAKEKGFTRIVFDRAGYLYHGRVKAFAESLRKGGLEF